MAVHEPFGSSDVTGNMPNVIITDKTERFTTRPHRAELYHVEPFIESGTVGIAGTDGQQRVFTWVHEHEFRQAISILYPGIVFPESHTIEDI